MFGLNGWKRDLKDYAWIITILATARKFMLKVCCHPQSSLIKTCSNKANYPVYIDLKIKENSTLCRKYSIFILF